METISKAIDKDLKRERLERLLPIAANAVLDYFPTTAPKSREWAERVVLYASRLADALDEEVENNKYSQIKE